MNIMPHKQPKRNIGPCNDNGGDGPGGSVLTRVTESSAKAAGVIGVPFKPPYYPNYFKNFDVIAKNVLRFLGVRGLVYFGATSKSHRIAMEREVKCRKKNIAETEIEVM
jgi:hypothetical protein